MLGHRQAWVFLWSIVALFLFVVLISAVSGKQREPAAPATERAPVLVPIGPSHPVGVPLPMDTAPRGVLRSNLETQRVAGTLCPALSTVQRRQWCLSLAGWQAVCVTRTVQAQLPGR